MTNLEKPPHSGHPGFATEAEAAIYYNQTSILTWLRAQGVEVAYVRDPTVPSMHLPPARKSIGEPCPYCLIPMTKNGRHGITKDHKVPKSRGGRLTGENRLIVCAKCNSEKGNQTIEEWVVRLQRGNDRRVHHILVLITGKVWSSTEQPKA